MTGDEILALLQQGGGQEIDFKAERTSARKLAESLVALANASGGAVLVGVDPRTSASGSAELTVEGSVEPSAKLQGLKGAEAARDKAIEAALLTDPPPHHPLARGGDLSLY